MGLRYRAHVIQRHVCNKLEQAVLIYNVKIHVDWQ